MGTMNLYLVQHAKAKPAELDPERPLTEEGMVDARRVASFVSRNTDTRVAAILHSGLLRAQQTAQIFAEYLHRKKAIDARDYRTYRELYETLVSELKPPDLMIYLQCSTKALMKRIERRGRKSEEDIPRSYVDKLNELYEEWFARYDRSPTLVIQSEKMDYIEDLFGRHDLLKTIEKHL